MLVEMVTPKGYHFWGESLVTIDGKDYPLDEMNQAQRDYVCAVRDVNALNAAFWIRHDSSAHQNMSLVDFFQRAR